MIYTCPMHPEIRQQQPGNCPICTMKLVPDANGQAEKKSNTPEKSFFAQYKPLFTIVGLIILPSFVAALHTDPVRVDWFAFMQNWMAGFFLVFSGFKLLNVRGFAKGYSTYDLLAMRWQPYGLLYPFIELLLGLAYIVMPLSVALNVFTLVLMLFSGLGVAIKLAKKENFRCACLGTFIDVPLTKVTLVEDFGMALMAALMLLRLSV